MEHNNRKNIIMILCVLICLISAVFVFPSVCFAKEKDAKTVRVAYVLSPGYQEGGEGEYKTGYGYEYLQRIASINNWQYEYVYGSFSELLEKLENGEIDLMGNLSYTKERAKKIAYGTYEQGKENYYLYVRENSKFADASDFSELDGIKVGLNAGSYQKTAWEKWCKEQNITSEIIEYKKFSERYDALNSGKIDAITGGIVQLEEQTADWKVITDVGSSPFYFGVSKSRSDLLKELNAAQKKILEENPFYNEEIYDRYMRTLSLTITNLDDEEKEWLREHNEHNDQIKVGYLKGFQPISYQDENGDFKGVAADALQAIEDQYKAENLSFETVPYKDYDTMIDAIKNGEISVAWPIYMDYWNADQNGVAITKQVMSASMLLVFDGKYTAETVKKIGVVKRGSLPKVYAKINYPESTLVEFDNYNDATDGIIDGTVSCVLYETSLFQVNDMTNEKLSTLNTVALQKSFGITFAVATKDRYLGSIMDKGITVFGDAGANRALLSNSVVENKITTRQYLEQNPIIGYVVLGVLLAIIAGIILFVLYSRMSFRVKTSQAEKEIYEKLSNSDPLTGLYNRQAVFRRCQELLQEYPEEQFVMLHIDMVHFRLYNTFFGDEVGDKLLCDIADCFRGMSKDYDYWAYGRIESDVFCVFFPYEEKRYQKHFTQMLQYLKNYRSDFLVEPKIGMYFVTDRAMPIESMFTRATLAAREVQSHTPNATVIYDDKLEKGLNEKQQITNEMQAAIDQEQFKVYLQPKYALRSNKMVGAEALVRWYHPVKGMISPGVFIPIFESNGFITTLDRYMWEHVCQLLSAWKKEGKTLFPVSVNVSRLSMFGSTTVEFLKELVKKYDIDPKYLELELTESAYMDDPEEMKAQMYALKEAGFTILLDDFGSGYSSLNTLREIPVNVLKLDMKFLSMDQTDLRGGLVISSVVRMAKLLKLLVIAEGVETKEQADYLKGIGCEYVQGFLFSRPMPVSDYEKLFANSTQPLEHVNQPLIDHIGKIIAETGSGTYAMGTVIPTPLACMEYADRQFAFLRVNPAFYTEFSDSDDSESISVVFKKHLPEKSFDDFIRAMENSMLSGKKVRVPILWNAKDGKQQKYICSVVYEGNIGESATFVVTFINVTDLILTDSEEVKKKNSAQAEEKLWNCVKDLVAAKDIKIVTNNILQEVMKYYDAERSYIFEFDWDRKIGINTYEICAPNVEPVIDTLQEVPLEIMDAWLNLFHKNSLIHIKDLQALLCDESRKEEYEVLAEQGIKSLIAVPVYHEKKLIGFLGVDNPKCNLDDTAVIESLAFFCVNESLREKKITDLERMSMLDPLTGVYNRKAWKQKQSYLQREKIPYSLLIIDIDNYKKVNDQFGHQIGDEVLKRVVSALQELLRANDMIVRYGGDEFLVILENTNAKIGEILSKKVEKLNEILAQPTDKLPGVTVSVGIAFSEDCDVTQLLSNADHALYHIKNSGKKGWHIYKEEKTDQK